MGDSFWIQVVHTVLFEVEAPDLHIKMMHKTNFHYLI
jgi:hypothetical protein